MNKKSRIGLRPLLGLALALLPAAALSAADLAVVREQTGRYNAYGMTDSGFAKLPIELPQVTSVAVGGGLAKVTYGRQVWLFGLTGTAIVTRRIDDEMGGSLTQLALGDRVAVAQGPAGTAIYGVGEKEIIVTLMKDRVSQFQLSGNIVYVRTALRNFLLAPTKRLIAVLDLGPQPPTRLQMARGQAVTYWQKGTFLHAPTAEAIESVQIARTAPADVILGGMLPAP